MVSESPKMIKGKNGDAVILIPQPTDDPEDPLVSVHIFDLVVANAGLSFRI
jgi:hypothetical protein